MLGALKPGKDNWNAFLLYENGDFIDSAGRLQVLDSIPTHLNDSVT